MKLVTCPNVGLTSQGPAEFILNEDLMFGPTLNGIPLTVGTRRASPGTLEAEHYRRLKMTNVKEPLPLGQSSEYSILN